MSFSISTDRLLLSELEASDVQFIYDLFTDPDCLRFIGDRGINNCDDASDYLANRLIESYKKHGYGLYKVTTKIEPGPIGICGLVKRVEDKPPDIGFAFLPQYRSGGFCTEAAQAILEWAKINKISDEILAYTNPDNAASIRVLEKIGLQQQSITTLPGQDFKSVVMNIHFN